MVSCIGSEMGKVAIAGRDCVTNQQINSILVDDKWCADYVYYFLSIRKAELQNLAGGGSAQPILNKGHFSQIQIVMPPLSEQRAIAHILGTLDDKIEFNRRMNETLEAMSRAIFKSWFVDFDPVRAKAQGRDPGLPKPIADLFPDRFQDSDLGETPKRWHVGKVNDLATLSRAGLDPGEFPDEVFDHYSIPAFDEGRVPKAETGAAIKSNKFIVQRDCVLLSKLNPRIPRVWLPDVRGSHRAVCSTEFFVALCRSGVSREFLFGLFSSGQFTSPFATLVTGTSGSHQRVKPESLLKMDAVIPPQPLTRSFTEAAKPLLELVSRNIEESRTLAAIRGALLPKLLSGEVRLTSPR